MSSTAGTDDTDWHQGRTFAHNGTDTFVGTETVEYAKQIVNAVNTRAEAEELEAEVQRLRAALECIIAKFRGVQCQEPTCDGFIGGAMDVARAALAKGESDALAAKEPAHSKYPTVRHSDEAWRQIEARLKTENARLREALVKLATCFQPHPHAKGQWLILTVEATKALEQACAALAKTKPEKNNAKP